ncbi:MAG: PAS domain S-box protein, partial [Candidatus Binataceae bacterium]
VIRDFETHGLRKDGALIDIALTASLITGANGEPLGMSFVGRDITEECKARRTLEETRRWLRQILDHAPLMVTAVDKDGIYTMVEGQALKTMGIADSQALIGHSAFAMLGPDSAAAAATRRALEGETSAAAATMNGHTFEMWKAPIRDASGRITGAIGVSTDVSGRVAIERELQARLLQQETITSISASALAGASFDGLAHEAAESVQAALGVDYAGVFLRNEKDSSFEICAVAIAPAMTAGLNDSGIPPPASIAAYAISAGAPIIADDLAEESRFEPDPMGQRLGLTSAIAIAFGPADRPRGAIAAYAREAGKFTRHDANFVQSVANILTNSIANAEAQQNLQRSEAYFRSLIAHTSDVLTVIDRKGIIRFVGGAFEEMFGYPRAQVIGQPSISFVGPERRDAVKEATKHAFRHPGSVTRVEYRQSRADSSWVDCEAFMRTVNELSDETSLVVSMRDISDRKRHEEEIARARDEALESARLKSAFLANMSHEVRTPINIIVGYSDLVAEYLAERGDDSQAEYLNAITRAGQRLLRTIGAIIDYSKLGAGLLKAAPAMVTLSPLIERQLSNVEELARKKGLILTYDSEVPSAKVWFDEYCLANAVSNLLENAIKFTPKGGVTVRVYQDSGGALCLSLTDTGIGIDVDYLPRLLEPFSQEDASVTRRFEGAGLGLALAKGYLECNGAQLTVASHKGEGSTFTIKFPGPPNREHSALSNAGGGIDQARVAAA